MPPRTVRSLKLSGLRTKSRLEGLNSSANLSVTAEALLRRLQSPTSLVTHCLPIVPITKWPSFRTGRRRGMLGRQRRVAQKRRQLPAFALGLCCPIGKPADLNRRSSGNDPCGWLRSATNYRFRKADCLRQVPIFAPSDDRRVQRRSRGGQLVSSVP